MTYGKIIKIGLTLFGATVLISLATFYISLGNCQSGSFSCDDGKSCIPQKLICNFERDCKDGQDESVKMCGNFHGSNAVVDAVFADSARNSREQEEKYNYTITSDRNMCLFSDDEIPVNCKCQFLYNIRCRNITKIPQRFPEEVVIINLSNNRIDLELNESNIFRSYKNLTYLDIQNNSLGHLPQGFLSNATQLRKLFLQFNRISNIPNDLFLSLHQLRWLMLNKNQIRDFNFHLLWHLEHLQLLQLANNRITLEGRHFPKLMGLNELFLDDNFIEILNEHHFSELKSITLISLRNNRLTYITKHVFNKLHTLVDLRLSGNPIVHIEDGFASHLRKLNALYLDELSIPITKDLLATVNVSFLSLKGIFYESIDFKALERMKNLKHIMYEKFIYCSNTPAVKVCMPKVGNDGLSSTSDILEKTTLRYAVWFMALVTFVGNASVLWGRLKFRDENRNVSIVIRNLAFSDLLMGIYLAFIGYTDAYYRGEYHENSGEWVKSWQCVFIGSLAMASSEVSILILTFMSIERFLLISDPFGQRKIDTKNVILALFIIWLLGFFIAIFPVILFHTSTKYYAIHNGPTCFPLFIEEVYQSGWIYSAFVFLGINFTLLILIATLYTALILSIYRTRRATSLNFLDCEFAVRFFFIVLTDACCWAPIIVLKFLAFYNIEVSGDVTAWLIIFVLPLNSAVNPLLFTYTTPKYRDQIFAAFTIKRQSLKKQEVNSNQNTAEDSQTKVSLLSNSNASISKWKIFSK